MRLIDTGRAQNKATLAMVQALFIAGVILTAAALLEWLGDIMK